MSNFNILIFTTAKNINITKCTVCELVKTRADNIKVITPHNDIQIYNQLFKENVEIYLGKVQIVSDEELDPKGAYRLQLSLIMNNSKRIGWYYQQYLKIKAASKSEIPTWVLDGDTYFNKSFVEYYTTNKIIPGTKEKISHYNESLIKIFPDLNVENNFSYIANCSFIDPILLNKLFTDPIEIVFTKWINCIIKDKRIDISEYQLFGNIMVGNSYNKKLVKFYRRADLLLNGKEGEIEVIEKLKNKYDIIGFEFNHKAGKARKIMAKILLLVNYSW